MSMVKTNGNTLLVIKQAVENYKKKIFLLPATYKKPVKENAILLYNQSSDFVKGPGRYYWLVGRELVRSVKNHQGYQLPPINEWSKSKDELVNLYQTLPSALPSMTLREFGGLCLVVGEITSLFYIGKLVGRILSPLLVF